MVMKRLFLAGAALGGVAASWRALRLQEPVSLCDKVVVITGASSGIGKAAAHAFAREGAQLVLAARRVEKLCEVADALADCGTPVLIAPTDVTRDADLQALVETAVRAFGRIDVLVNNAGLSYGSYHQDLEPTCLRDLVQVNVYGPLRLTQLVLPVMLRQGYGHIVNVSSMAGLIPAPGLAAYAATRTAIISFSTALRRELAGSGVRVSAVMPTFTSTPMTQAVSEASLHRSGALILERFDPPEVPAAAIVNAVRYNRRETLMGGVQIRIGAVLGRLAPGLIDRFWRKSVNTPDFIKAMGGLGEGS